VSDLAEEKKRAEVESDEAWAVLVDFSESLIDGETAINEWERVYRDFKLAHNTERGLRHELEND